MDKVPTKWNGYNNVTIVTVDEQKCAKIVGVKENTKALTYNITNKIDTTNTNQEYTISAWVRLDGYSAGTTNPYLAFYFGGRTTTDSPTDEDTELDWLGATWISKDGALSYGNLVPYNGAGWVKVYGILKFAQPVSNMNFNVYVRDCECNLYVRDLKLEKGNIATEWSPAPEDLLPVETREY